MFLHGIQGDLYNNMYNCAETTVKGPICTMIEIQPLAINQHYGRCQHKKAIVINTTIAQPIHTKNNLFFDEKKRENLPIIQPSLQFYGIVLEKTTAKEWHGCHFKNCLFIVGTSTLRINYETNSSDQ